MLGASLNLAALAIANHGDTGEVEGPFSRGRRSHSIGLVAGDGRPLAVHLSSPEKFWVRLTDVVGRPELREDARFRAAALTAGGQVGWVVGAVGAAAPLALVTEDGGATWTDVSALVRAHAPETRLHAVHLFDESHVWIGGENGLLLSGGY